MKVNERITVVSGLICYLFRRPILVHGCHGYQVIMATKLYAHLYAGLAEKNELSFVLLLAWHASNTPEAISFLLVKWPCWTKKNLGVERLIVSLDV